MRIVGRSNPRSRSRFRSFRSSTLAVGTALTVLAGLVQVTGVAQAAPATTPAPAASSGGASGDVALDGFGDESGYHLQVADGSAAWREVAILRPAGLDPASWVGYQCLSGDGKFAAVAVLPASSVNLAQARDHGAFAYSVDLATGAVHPVASGVGLKYYSPGCGTADSAVFTTSLGTDNAATVLTTADLATGNVTSSVTVKGQVTSAVPTASGPMAVAGSSVVSVAGDGSLQVVAAVSGDAYELRPAADGGVDFLTTDQAGATAAAHHAVTGSVTDLGSGPRTRLHMFGGRSGAAILAGAATSDSAAAAAAKVAVVPDKGLPQGASSSSLDGSVLIGATSGGSDQTTAQAPTAVVPATGAISTVPRVGSADPDSNASSSTGSGASGSASTSTATSTAVPAYVPPGVADQVGQDPAAAAGSGLRPSGDAAPAAYRLPTGSATATAVPAVLRLTTAQARTTSVSAQAVAASTQTPTCAVAPGDVAKQVMQPSPAQADWAAQMAEQGLLSGSSSTRPANWQNLGFPAYSPSTDFPLIPLSHPSGTTTSTVPRVVFEAIMAQESNFNQASWHAPAGNAGDPLIADYYGAAGDIVSMNYAGADCGYGISQVTDGMHVGDHSLSARGQVKVALDYQENIAAGLQILEGKWNQLYSAGIIANNGDPQDLENWYLAIWAYNGGVQPGSKYNSTGCTPGPTCTGPDGTWGLGWTNNPDNLDYPPSRAPFLQTSYADAAHPANWPYQERVMGWMASPIVRYGVKAYDKATYHGGLSWLQIPATNTFCTLADNHCDPVATNTSNPGATHCMLDDFECWWHQPVAWIATCATTCATSPYTVGSGSTEPTFANQNPPTCAVDTSKVASNAIVVDDETAPPANLQGCGAPNWSPGGSFTLTPGTNAAGDPIGQIDIHQLGVGLGGHVWFSHTEDGSNPALINTGTWTPSLPSLQYYTVKIHVPSIGATATNVVYTINPGGNATPWKIRVNQSFGSEQWATIGTFAMQNGGSVSLSNQSAVTQSAGQHAYNFDVAWDAVAFVPQGGTPGTPIGGPPTVQDEPKGSNPAWLNCGCAKRTAGDPVDTSTGYFGDAFTDLTVPGRGMPLAFTRSYAAATADPTGPNATLAKDGPFGYGWTDSYNLTAATDSSSGAVTITQEDGSRVPFTKSGSTFTTSAPRFDATLTVSGSSYVFTRSGRSVYTFDTTTGRLTSETTLAGTKATPAYATALAYDGNGHLSTVTDPAGRKLTLTWTGSHISALTDTAGRRIDYAYDSSGNLTDVYGVATNRAAGLGSNDRFQYTYVTGKHLVASMRTPKNYTSASATTASTTMTYDSADRVLTQTDPTGKATTFVYGPSTTPSLTAGQTLVTDPAGHKTLDTYTNGLLTSETKGYGTTGTGTWTYTYDPISLGVSTASDPDGNLQTYSYDNHGNQIAASNALGYTTLATYDDAGDVIESVDPMGVATVNAYDQAGHINTSSTTTNAGSFTYGDLTSTTVTQAANVVESSTGNVGTAPARTTNFYYTDPAHPADLTKTVDPNNHTGTATYDTYGDQTSVTDALGNTSKAGYNTATGWITSTVTANGVAAGIAPGCSPPANGCSTVVRDAYGRPTTSTDPLGHTTTATYDADGAQLTTTDANGKTTTTSYDTAGRPTLVTAADNTTVTTDYNPDSTVADTIDGLGRKTTYSYNGQGRLVSTTDPDNRTSAATLDHAGRTTKTTDALGRTVTPTLDAAGQLTKLAYSDGTTPTVSYGYDADGRRTTMTDGSGTTSTTYDTFGQITTATNGAGATVAYSYDTAGNLTGLTYPGQTTTVARSFDAANRLTSVKDFAGKSTTFGYDHNGALTTTAYPDGVTVTNTFNTASQLTGTTAAKGSTTVSTLAYGRDNAGQVTSQTAAGATQTFGYNSREQLASSNGGATGTGGTASYAMDAANHPTTVGTTTQTFDPAGQECWSSTTTVTSPVCATVPTGATKYTFDGVGERTKTTPATGTASSYGYDQAGRLTTAATPAGSGTYTYNGDGLRTSKTISGATTRFTWDTAAQLLSDGTTSYLYGPDGAPIEQVNSTATLYFVHDQVGSTRTLLDANGAAAGGYTYTPYGVATHTGTAASVLQYTGQYSDAETGLLYLRARYYDPATALFLTIDPLVARTGTPYAYVNGNPLNDADPTGLCGFWCIITIVAVDVGEEVLTEGAATGAILEEDEAIVAAFDGGEAVAEETAAEVESAAPIRTQGPGPRGGESSSAARGRQMHQDHDYGPGFEKEFKLNSGRRADAVNEETGEVVELKPDNPRAMRSGAKQVQRYVDELNQTKPREPGGCPWTGKVIGYQ